MLRIAHEPGRTMGKRAGNGGPSLRFPQTGFKILLVEDNVVNQKVTARMVEKAGHRCDVVANGKEALEALSRTFYDLVLMNCEMPVMDGYHATEEVRRREAGKVRTPIIAMTAHAVDEGWGRKCLDAGMDDHIGIPVTKEALHEILETHLPQARDRAREGKKKPPPPEPVRIERIREIADGDLDFERELIVTFLSDMELHMAGLQRLVRGLDAEGMRAKAHAVKGSTANAGAQGMVELAGKLETMGAKGEMEPAPQILENLMLEFERVRTYFRNYLEELRASNLQAEPCR